MGSVTCTGCECCSLVRSNIHVCSTLLAKGEKDTRVCDTVCAVDGAVDDEGRSISTASLPFGTKQDQNAFVVRKQITT